MSQLFGVCHNVDTGEAITRLARSLRCSIGYPRGSSAHLYIGLDSKIIVEWFTFQQGQKPKRGFEAFSNMPEAEEFYRIQRPKADVAPYPRRLGYFTFLRVGADGEFQHDAQAILAAGPVPTSVDITFVSNEPLEQKFEYWTAAELKCHGDGKDAERRVSFEPKTPEQTKLASRLAAEGRTFFPILDGCYARGCPYARPDAKDRTACKPHSRLSFQLRNSIRLGGTCSYDSTGFRSASWLFSSLQAFRQITGRGDPEQGTVAGLPVSLKVQPYRTSHAGKPSTQYGVSLEMKAKDALTLMRGMQKTAFEYGQMIGAAAKQLGAPAEIEPTEAERFLSEKAEAKSMAAEFYPVETDTYQSGYDDDGPTDAPEKPVVRRKSETVAQALEGTAKAAAAKGLTFYEAFWKTLKSGERKILESSHPANKEAARLADLPPAERPSSKATPPDLPEIPEVATLPDAEIEVVGTKRIWRGDVYRVVDSESDGHRWEKVENA